MLLDIGPLGDGRASDDPLGLKYGLEQRVTEKREQLALQLDNLGQYDGRLLLHEVEDSAADARRGIAYQRGTTEQEDEQSDGLFFFLRDIFAAHTHRGSQWQRTPNTPSDSDFLKMYIVMKHGFKNTLPPGPPVRARRWASWPQGTRPVIEAGTLPCLLASPLL